MPFLLISYTMEREEYLQKCGCDVCRGRLMRCAYGSSFTVGTAVMPRDHYAALQAEKLCRDALVLGGVSNTLPLKDIPLAIVTENFRGIISMEKKLFLRSMRNLISDYSTCQCDTACNKSPRSGNSQFHISSCFFEEIHCFIYTFTAFELFGSFVIYVSKRVLNFLNISSFCQNISY